MNEWLADMAANLVADLVAVAIILPFLTNFSGRRFVRHVSVNIYRDASKVAPDSASWMRIPPTFLILNANHTPIFNVVLKCGGEVLIEWPRIEGLEDEKFTMKNRPMGRPNVILLFTTPEGRRRSVRGRWDRF